MGDGFTSPPRKARCGFFRPKNPTASAGIEPAILGTRGQHANHWILESRSLTPTKVIQENSNDLEKTNTILCPSLYFNSPVHFIKGNIIKCHCKSVIPATPPLENIET